MKEKNTNPISQVFNSENMVKYFKKCSFKNKIVIVGEIASNAQVTKYGLKLPAIFWEGFFDSKGKQPAIDGVFFPLLITDKKHISKDVRKSLKEHIAVELEHYDKRKEKKKESEE